MIGLLRVIGLMNAAVWFGGSVAFTFVLGPSVFSADMRQLLGPANQAYFTGAIAQVLVGRYFDLQMICALIALFHALAERIYCGRPLSRLWTGLLLGLFAASLLGGLALEPKIKRLHVLKYAVNRAPAERAAAGRSLALWHGVSQTVNLLALAGLAAYTWRVAQPANAARFIPAAKFQD